jgi:hypothetical protein
MRGSAEIGPISEVYDAAMNRGAGNGGRRALAAAVASCVLLAACGGSGSDDASTATDASTTTAAATTTTESTATTTATTEAPTTETPTTTLDTDEQLAAAEQAYLDAFDAYIAAARDPANPELRADIERLYTGPNLEFTINQLDSFVEQNWVALPGEEPSRTIILLSPQFLPDRTDFVELVNCEVDSEIFVEPGGAPDGSDALVSDEVVVRRGLTRLELIGGQWKSRSGEVLAELASAEECVP